MSTLLHIILFVYLAQSKAYNILGVFPHIGKSHFDVFSPLLKALAQKGHNITVLSHFPLEKPIANYKDIQIEATSNFLADGLDINRFSSGGKLLKYYGTPALLAFLSNTTCDLGLGSKAVQNFLSSKEKFDLMIIELFNSDCFLGLSHKVKAPIVGISSSTLMPWTSERFGNPSHTAYIPNNFLDHSDRMTFFERLENTVVTVLHQLVYDYYVRSQDERLIRKHISTKASQIQEVVMNISLLLANTHFTLNLPRPLVPNVVEVGGLHIGKVRPLSKHLEKWVSGAPEGVIYFSLGSMIKGHTFPDDKRNAFLNAFKRLPQRVLWKWEDEMEGKPDNVMIQKWMPQLDILCHPNVKVFISHGGLLGTTEAVHCGVPVIVMPQFGDQHTNAKALEASGGGVILHLSDATEDTVYKALKKVLSPGFRQKSKELSERFRDRPLPPLETAIYWVEYVARHRGAPHMRTAAVNMPFYKYYLIDVAAFLLLVFGVWCYVSFLVIRFIVRKIVKRKTETPKEKTT